MVVKGGYRWLQETLRGKCSFFFTNKQTLYHNIYITVLTFDIIIVTITIITKINNIATLKESYLRLNFLRTEETNTFSSIVANLWGMYCTPSLLLRYTIFHLYWWQIINLLDSDVSSKESWHKVPLWWKKETVCQLKTFLRLDVNIYHALFYVVLCT